MIPVGAIGAIIAAVATASRSSSGAPPPGGRSALFFLAWMFGTFALVMGIALLVDGEVVGLPIAAAGALITFPWPLARFATIPLGFVKTTWLLAVFADWTWGRDRWAGAYAAAILAYRAKPTSAGARFLAGLEKNQKRSGGALATALGLLADHHGDVDGARSLFSMERLFDPSVTPRLARCIAREWLAADLAARGQWQELAAFDGGGSRMVALLVRAARRLTGTAKSPSDFALRCWWLFAPARRATRPLLLRALTAPRRRHDATAEVDVDAAPVAGESKTALAVRLHTAALRRPAAVRTGDGLSRVARAWQEALADAPYEVQDGVVDALVELVQQTDMRDVAIAEHGNDLMERAIERVRGERLLALEQASDALQRRAESTADLPPADELREVAALVRVYEEAARAGHEAQRLAWEACHYNVCNVGVRFWNIRKETRLGNLVFRWLHEEAVVNHDAANIELHTKNLKCGP